MDVKGIEDLTNAEVKMLEALKDPENYLLSVSEFCKKADVGRNTYYTALKKPLFRKLRNEILNEVFTAFVPDIKRAAIQFGINNAKNFQDRKLVLEMSGEYTPKQEVVNTEVNKDVLADEFKEFRKGNK